MPCTLRLDGSRNASPGSRGARSGEPGSSFHNDDCGIASLRRVDQRVVRFWNQGVLSGQVRLSILRFGVPRQHIAFTYDARNRLTGTGFGDRSPGIGRSYTPDGLPLTVVSNCLLYTSPSPRDS